jgi:hypothetical protein
MCLWGNDTVRNALDPRISEFLAGVDVVTKSKLLYPARSGILTFLSY